MSRQSGYYWVKQGRLWEPAWYCGTAKSWVVVGSNSMFSGCIFDEINETRILAPDEVSNNENLD